jgi:hypothetical protein
MADETTCQNGRWGAQPAKMAGVANIMPNKKFLSTIFSSFFC